VEETHISYSPLPPHARPLPLHAMPAVAVPAVRESNPIRRQPVRLVKTQFEWRFEFNQFFLVLFNQLKSFKTTTAVISCCRKMLLLLRTLAFFFVLPPPSPSDDGESESPDESLPSSPEHRVMAAQPPPPQLYANQEDWPGGPDHPDRQTCQLAGSVGHYRCSPCRPCCRPRLTAEIYISLQITLPVSATNGHGDIALSWEVDFDWSDSGAAAATIWTQDEWEENVGVGAAAAANNLYNYMEERNNAAAAAANNDDAPRWNGADWTEEDWENQDLPLVYPINRAGSPQSIHSSMPGLEIVPPTPSPLPPPLQLQYMPHGEAGPTYALQVGPSLLRQPVEERVTLLHQLRNDLISETEEEQILARRSSPPAAVAAAAVVYAGRRHSSPTAVKFARRRHSI
jgi:hypothetical protein